jgi:hypothetical protein
MVLVYEVMNILLDCQCWNDHAQTNDDRLKWIPKRKLGSIMKGYTKQRPGNLAFWDETNAFGHKRWLSLESPQWFSLKSNGMGIWEEMAFWDETNAFGHKRWLSLESPQWFSLKSNGMGIWEEMAFWDETNAFGHKRWLSLESPQWF